VTRILHVIDSLGPGGAERSLASMAPFLVGNGIDLEVAYLKDRVDVLGSLEEAGATIFGLTGARNRAAWVQSIHRLIVDRRPDLVHTTLFDADVCGRVAARLARVPVVSSLVNVEYGPEQFADPRLRAWRLRAAQIVDSVTARAVVRFHAITAHVADVMTRRLRLPVDRVDVIPRGRDPALLGTKSPGRRDRARRLLGILPEERLVVAAARHEYQKGLDVLLEAFASVRDRLPSARLVVAGREGNLTLQLRGRARSFEGGVVRLLGARDDVPELLCAADLFVLPSRWEGLGSVLLEAMALEAPIVASDLPAVREVLSDGIEASFVRPQDPIALGEAIVHALDAPAEAANRAARARERFLRSYTTERITRRIVAFYERALTDRRSLGAAFARSPGRGGR
jgi:glycosyltransferase involved in cell wall biosynthesis